MVATSFENYFLNEVCKDFHEVQNQTFVPIAQRLEPLENPPWASVTSSCWLPTLSLLGAHQHQSLFIEVMSLPFQQTTWKVDEFIWHTAGMTWWRRQLSLTSWWPERRKTKFLCIAMLSSSFLLYYTPTSSLWMVQPSKSLKHTDSGVLCSSPSTHWCNQMVSTNHHTAPVCTCWVLINKWLDRSSLSGVPMIPTQHTAHLLL